MQCYFCKLYNTSYKNYNSLCICNTCEELISPIKFNVEETNKCSYCCKNAHLVELRFSHKICLKCCKIIYFDRKQKKCCIMC